MFDIRPLLLAHLDELQQLESQCFAPPISRTRLEQYIEQENFLALGLFNNELIGFAVCTLVLDQAELLQIGIAPDWRKQRLASKLLQQLVKQLKAKQINQVFLEVRQSNVAAQQLYFAADFSQQGYRKNYYSALSANGTSEHALLLAKILD